MFLSASAVANMASSCADAKISLSSLKILGSLITHICLFRENTFFIPASSKQALNVIPSPGIILNEVERVDNEHHTASSASGETSDSGFRKRTFKQFVIRFVTRG